MRGRNLLLNNTRLQDRVVETSVSVKQAERVRRGKLAVVLRHKFSITAPTYCETKEPSPERYQVDFDCEISKCGCGVVFGADGWWRTDKV